MLIFFSHAYLILFPQQCYEAAAIIFIPDAQMKKLILKWFRNFLQSTHLPKICQSENHYLNSNGDE